MDLNYDLAVGTTRELNQKLNSASTKDADVSFRVLNPKGAHALAVGMTSNISVDIEGHVGYYCAGMNQKAHITVLGNAGPAVAENMMSGRVAVSGNVSHYAAASAHGGLLVVEGDSSSRCGISLKGAHIVVKGSVGHMSAFMAQSGSMVVCGDAGEALGDSLYEARLYVRGNVASLGTDCVEKTMLDEHKREIDGLLERSGITDADASEFRRFGSARKLYNFDVDNADAY